MRYILSVPTPAFPVDTALQRPRCAAAGPFLIPINPLLSSVFVPPINLVPRPAITLVVGPAHPRRSTAWRYSFSASSVARLLRARYRVAHWVPVARLLCARYRTARPRLARSRAARPRLARSRAVRPPFARYPLTTRWLPARSALVTCIGYALRDASCALFRALPASCPLVTALPAFCALLAHLARSSPVARLLCALSRAARLVRARRSLPASCAPCPPSARSFPPRPRSLRVSAALCLSDADPRLLARLLPARCAPSLFLDTFPFAASFLCPLAPSPSLTCCRKAMLLL
ncbi:hypothetical protein DFH06DRAFT_1337859 [Mycena polygramma]|nr:hypothetical protein DFH06DRAFT_1337859 [Mycena polygramma]